MRQGPCVHRKDIVEGLRGLGVAEGDYLLAHSSLSSFGHVDGGADCVIDALLEAIGPGGTLMLPTLTFSTVDECNPVFDVRRTPSVVGHIPEVFRQREGVLRSLHPTHSCAAAGPGAKDVLAGHEKDVTPCGQHSPFARLIDAGGKIVFLGVTLACNTTFHALEEMAGVPWLFDRWEELWTIDYDEAKIRVPSRRHSANMRRDFVKMEPILERESVMVKGRIGAAEIRLVNAAPMARLMLEMLTRDPFLPLADEAARRERRRYEEWVASK